MNKYQKEVIQSQLNDEKKTIQLLKRVYEQARDDCEVKIAQLSARKDMENLQSIIYQQHYQEVLKSQIEGILETLQGEEFNTIDEYLNTAYESGYIGTMYDIHHQGIPITVPIDQKQMVKAIQLDTRLSEGLYKRLGEDTKYLKRSIRAELSRGIAQGKSWNDIATHIARGMNSPFNMSYNKAIRIARTEGHRIQEEAGFHAQKAAKKEGADIVKQWDATLDSRTRDSHKKLDGKIKEIEDKFVVNGHSALYPGAFGVPEEDIHCRCTTLQRARWALDEKELETLKERADYFGLSKTRDFNDYKKKYLQLPADADTMKVKDDVLKRPVISKDPSFNSLLTSLDEEGVGYNPVAKHKTKVTDEAIISMLGGGDKTTGSCASVGLAYIGQKQGWNTLDFRGGSSQQFFSSGLNLYQMSQARGMSVLKADGKSSLTVGNRLLKQCEEGKEYYLVVGRHASIVRRLEGKLQYLELQSASSSGWTDFDGNPRYTLSWRFGCSSRNNFGMSSKYDFMLDIAESDFDNDDFKSLLGYLNTADDKQKKGVGGHVR